MWRNYLIVGFRSLVRSRAYAFINIFGLAFGLAACLLILLYVRYETSYDSWLQDHERIYQVQATWFEPGQPVSANQTSPFPVHDTIAGGFPQIEAVSIAQPGRLQLIRNGQPIFVDQLYVQPAFFEIFQFEFLEGDASAPLPNTNSLVLTETEALRQFGTKAAVGKTVTERIDNGTNDYVVTGIIKDLPRNSHLKLAAIARFDPAAYDDVPPEFKSWGSMNQYHYVKLRPGADAAAINAALSAWERRVIPPQIVDGAPSSRADIMDLKLVPVTGVHLGEAQGGAMTPGNDTRTIATFTIVATLILAMACINFINLSTARAGQRAREVALRKVLGASRRQLILQFLAESIMLAAVAMLLALTLVELAMPSLSAYLEADLSYFYFGVGGFLLPALALVVIVGAIGGLYPAFYLSGFKPASVLKANKSSADPHGSGRLRNILVISQFAISIGLIVCTTIVYSQTRYVQTVDPGFEREGLIQIAGAWRFQDSGNYEAMKQELARVKGVAAVARTNMAVAARNKSIQSVAVPGQTETLNNGFYWVDPDYFSTMGMRFLAGRPLGDGFANDRVISPGDNLQQSRAALAARGLNVVINRRAAAQWGFKSPADAIGKQVKISIETDDMVPSTVVGVVEDTRFRSARDPIEPLIFGYDPDHTTQIVVRYRSSDPAAAMAGLQHVWSRFFPEIPFEGAFSEDLIAELYEGDSRRGMIFAAFAVLAVLIACLGLFGLAAFTTERRTKEIGIRKVLGATVRHIMQLLAWQFSKPVIVANLLAWPVAWWVMRDWLNTFDARIALTPGPFVFAGLLALAIAVATVAGHALRVARLNPIIALRYE